MTLISLRSHRDDSFYDGAVCTACGSAWFRLGGEHAQVCLDQDGSITGYSGHLYCSSCGKPFHPSPH